MGGEDHSEHKIDKTTTQRGEEGKEEEEFAYVNLHGKRAKDLADCFQSAHA